MARFQLDQAMLNWVAIKSLPTSIWMHSLGLTRTLSHKTSIRLLWWGQQNLTTKTLSKGQSSTILTKPFRGQEPTWPPQSWLWSAATRAATIAQAVVSKDDFMWLAAKSSQSLKSQGWHPTTWVTATPWATMPAIVPAIMRAKAMIIAVALKTLQNRTTSLNESSIWQTPQKVAWESQIFKPNRLDRTVNLDDSRIVFTNFKLNHKFKNYHNCYYISQVAIEFI